MVMHLTAFILLCIGVQICWNGIHGLWVSNVPLSMSHEEKTARLATFVTGAAIRRAIDCARVLAGLWELIVASVSCN